MSATLHLVYKIRRARANRERELLNPLPNTNAMRCAEATRHQPDKKEINP
jgi:hypothetical protein